MKHIKIVSAVILGVIAFFYICISFVDPNAGYIRPKIDALAKSFLGPEYVAHGPYKKTIGFKGVYLLARDVSVPMPLGEEGGNPVFDFEEIRIGASPFRWVSGRPWGYIGLEKNVEKSSALRARFWIKTSGSHFDLDVKDLSYGSSSASADIRVRTNESGAHVVSGDVNVAYIDLNHLVLLSALSNKIQPVLSQKKPKNPSPSYAFDVTFDVDSLAVQGVVFGNLTADLKKDSNKFEVKSQGVLSGGDMTAHVAIDTTLANVKFDLTGFDYGRILKTTSFQDKAEGKLNLAVDLASQSSRMGLESFYKNLNGNVLLTGKEGRLSNEALAFWSKDFLFSLIPFQEKIDFLDINCIALNLRAVDGRGKVENLLLDTKRMTVAGTGSYDFKTRNLDVLLKPKPKDIQFLNLATPVTVKGDIVHPDVFPATLGTAQKLGELALAAVNPLALAIPVVKAVTTEKNPCLEALNPPQKEGSQE